MVNDKWLLATRPKTLTGAMIPILLAGALAWHDGCLGNSLLQWTLLTCCALFSCSMQIAANLINDLYDYLKGTDREDRLGPERACAQGWITPKAMQRGILIVLLLAALIGLTAVALAWQLLPYYGMEFIIIGALSILFAFLYTTCLSYLGWGDVLVLVFFGLVPVCGSYYLLARTVTLPSLLLGLISGVAIDALLVINNYRDRDQDRLSGKKTLVVRFGERFGHLHYLMIGFIVLALTIWLSQLLEAPSLWMGCTIAYLGLHIVIWREMGEIHSGRALNQLLGKTSANMFLLSVILSLLIAWS